MRLRRPLVLAALCALAAVAACTLNPQPLPPGDDHFGGAADEDAGSSFGTFADSGRNDKQSEPTPEPSDAGAGIPEGGTDATPGTETDGGDAGEDGGDAGADADAG